VKVRIQKWGNSLALRIPESFASETNLHQESEVDLSVADGKLIISSAETPNLTLEQLLQGVTPENLHGEVETGPAVGAEAW